MSLRGLVVSPSLSQTVSQCCKWYQLRSISSSAKLYKSVWDEHPKAMKIAMEGTIGSEPSFSISKYDSFLPTPEILKQSFNGIPYGEIPILHIKATKNNTLINAVDAENKVIIYTSCRLEGFKNARKKTQIAGHATGVAAGQKLLRRGVKTVRIKVKGLGPGRMSSVKGLVSVGIEVVSITDMTRLNELGPRPKKVRRVG
uniref:30S ribosomal protein S11, chloroplastic n=1 Tax=Syphacia muris TaxID=451379 RepID=A0A0N5B0N6_9BILA